MTKCILQSQALGELLTFDELYCIAINAERHNLTWTDHDYLPNSHVHDQPCVIPITHLRY